MRRKGDHVHTDSSQGVALSETGAVARLLLALEGGVEELEQPAVDLQLVALERGLELKVGRSSSQRSQPSDKRGAVWIHRDWQR